mmetsp:Transcript_28444/g.71357  ORF Transcript_28444/g.71357 Transcript_28444/m.71357 type:complete len:140 (+) Transcript_28444:69-488(+)
MHKRYTDLLFSLDKYLEMTQRNERGKANKDDAAMRGDGERLPANNPVASAKSDGTSVADSLAAAGESDDEDADAATAIGPKDDEEVAVAAAESDDEDVDVAEATEENDEENLDAAMPSTKRQKRESKVTMTSDTLSIHT